MLLTMPFIFAFYALLSTAIELRAPRSSSGFTISRRTIPIS